LEHFARFVVDLLRRDCAMLRSSLEGQGPGFARSGGDRRRQMTQRFLVSLIALVGGVLPGSSALAAPACGAREEIVKQLAEEFKESPQAVGVVNKNAVIEVFVSKSGTFTIIASGTDGNSCVLSTGDSWQLDALAALPDA
jgi:hypothetical protein